VSRCVPIQASRTHRRLGAPIETGARTHAERRGPSGAPHGRASDLALEDRFRGERINAISRSRGWPTWKTSSSDNFKTLTAKFSVWIPDLRSVPTSCRMRRHSDLIGESVAVDGFGERGRASFAANGPRAVCCCGSMPTPTTTPREPRSRATCTECRRRFSWWSRGSCLLDKDPVQIDRFPPAAHYSDPLDRQTGTICCAIAASACRHAPYRRIRRRVADSPRIDSERPRWIAAGRASTSFSPRSTRRGPRVGTRCPAALNLAQLTG